MRFINFHVNIVRSTFAAALSYFLVGLCRANGNHGYHNKFNVEMDPLAPYYVEKLKWENGHVIDQNFYRVGLPSTVRESLVSYAKRIGIYKFVDDIYFNDDKGNSRLLDEGTNDFFTLENGENWYYQRPDNRWQSDMHWISPADKVAHDSFLEALADGGFDKVLDGIGRSLGFDGISCYQLTFIVLQNCEKGFTHHDFSDTGEKFFNVIIPMNLVPGSEPELDILDENGEVGKLKYEYDSAIMLGDYAYHASASSRNGKHIRIAATVYIGDINERNNENMGYTQYYPPNDPKERLKSAGEHWKADGSTSLRRYLTIAGRTDFKKYAERNEDNYNIKFLSGLCVLLVLIAFQTARTTTLAHRHSRDDGMSLPDHTNTNRVSWEKKGYIQKFLYRRRRGYGHCKRQI